MSSANGSSGSIGIEGDSAGTGEAWAHVGRAGFAEVSGEVATGGADDGKEQQRHPLHASSWGSG